MYVSRQAELRNIAIAKCGFPANAETEYWRTIRHDSAAVLDPLLVVVCTVNSEHDNDGQPVRAL